MALSLLLVHKQLEVERDQPRQTQVQLPKTTPTTHSYVFDLPLLNRHKSISLFILATQGSFPDLYSKRQATFYGGL